MTNACRMLATDVTSEYPLLWNVTFVSDKKYHELREDYRYQMAQLQRDFIASRFNFEVEGFKFNPYMEFSTVDPSGDPNTPCEDSLATLLLKTVVKDSRGVARQLFSKIQRSAKPGMWSFQGNHDLAKETREWIDTSLVPRLQGWLALSSDTDLLQSLPRIRRVQGRHNTVTNVANEAYLRQANSTRAPTLIPHSDAIDPPLRRQPSSSSRPSPPPHLPVPISQKWSHLLRSLQQIPNILYQRHGVPRLRARIRQSI